MRARPTGQSKSARPTKADVARLANVSTATVTSEGPLDPAAARAAVEEAGYTLVGA